MSLTARHPITHSASASVSPNPLAGNCPSLSAATATSFSFHNRLRELRRRKPGIDEADDGELQVIVAQIEAIESESAAAGLALRIKSGGVGRGFEDLPAVIVWLLCSVSGSTRKNIKDVNLQPEIAELRRSNQILQHTVNELLERIPAIQTRSRRCKSRDTRSEHWNDDSDSSTAIGSPAVPDQNPFTMEQLVRALEGTDRSIQVNVPDFEGRLNPDDYCDWIASLEAFFNWKNLCEERKVQYVTTKLKGHALVW
ncbi:hypothetical protein Droror1_Dr00027074 [Drosera rotundifolia]